MTLRLSGEHAAELVRAARAAAPHEACGLLLGRRAAPPRTGSEPVHEVVAVRAARNLAAEPRRRFELHPVDHLRAEEEAAARGLAVVGVWHSHPRGPAEPSARDRAGALPHVSTLVVGLAGSGGAELRSFRGSVEEPVLAPEVAAGGARRDNGPR